MSIDATLKSLGIELPAPPKPVASYVPAVLAGDRLYLSGMLPFRDGQVAITGKLGDIIQKRYLGFNWTNFNLTNEVFSVPILCWQSAKAVPDLQTITDKDVISVVYKESGEKYVFDDYISLFKTSKHV